jgi:hypothetical protein
LQGSRLPVSIWWEKEPYIMVQATPVLLRTQKYSLLEKPAYDRRGGRASLLPCESEDRFRDHEDLVVGQADLKNDLSVVKQAHCSLTRAATSDLPSLP